MSSKEWKHTSESLIDHGNEEITKMYFQQI